MKREYNYNSLPSEYEQLTYLESTGAQYINTGVIPTIHHKFILDAQSTNLSNTNCNGCSDYVNGNFIVAIDLRNPGYILYGIFGSEKIVRNNGSLDRRIFIAENGYLQISDVNVSFTAYTSEIPCYLTFYLFARNVNNSTQYYAKQKLYSFIIENDGILIRNMIPAKRLSDNKPGLYDTVNNVFYTNQGSGEFQYA